MFITCLVLVTFSQWGEGEKQLLYKLLFKSIDGCLQYFSRYCDGAVLLNLYRTAIVVFAFSLVLIFSWQSIYYVGAFTSHQHWQWHARHRCHCRRREHAASCSGLHIQCSICTNPTGVRPFHFSNPTNTEIIMMIIISVLLGVFSTVCKKNEDYGNWTVVRDDGDEFTFYVRLILCDEVGDGDDYD